MKKIDMLGVYFDNFRVGTLATAKDHRIAFEYDNSWLKNGFSINPISLPLNSGVFMPKGYEPFEGLFGVFSDSLPDGWGRLLVDRMLRREGIEPAEVDSLERLAIVGSSGMGALTYSPEKEYGEPSGDLSLDELAQECEKIMKSNEDGNLDKIFRLAGSSGGARPKVNYRIEEEDWIVKFASAYDKNDIGLQEYEYSLCAKDCGIVMAETRLISSNICPGYFAVKRFDREGSKRIHMISVAALLETSHRTPNLDYHILMQLVLKLTGDYSQIEQLYRLMCFNVFSHNRDDHSKNFSFLYDDGKGRWSLAPAYDLTYSDSIGGEHATTIDGNGRNPGKKDLLAVAEAVKLDVHKAADTADEIEAKVQKHLSKWI